MAGEVGQWLFRHRGWVPVPGAVALIAFARPPGALWLGGGLALIAIGETLRLWAVAHIGRRSRTRGDDVGPLVQSGPFAWSRNPLYVGNLLLWAGVGALAGRPILGVANVVLLGVHYGSVIRWEERNLEGRLGDVYRAYRARTARWFGPRRSQAGSRGADANWAEAARSERSTFASLVVVLFALQVVNRW